MTDSITMMTIMAMTIGMSMTITTTMALTTTMAITTTMTITMVITITTITTVTMAMVMMTPKLRGEARCSSSSPPFPTFLSRLLNSRVQCFLLLQRNKDHCRYFIICANSNNNNTFLRRLLAASAVHYNYVLQ